MEIYQTVFQSTEAWSKFVFGQQLCLVCTLHICLRGSFCKQRNSTGTSLLTRDHGDFFSLARFKAEARVEENIVWEFLYADDAALGASTASQQQELLDGFSCLPKVWTHNKLQEHCYSFTHPYPQLSYRWHDSSEHRLNINIQSLPAQRFIC